MRSLFEESIQTVNNMFYNLLNAWTQKKIKNQFTTLNHFLFWIFACRYNDIKQDIAEELASLREEGLLAKPGGKGQGGISFEIVDIATAGEDLSVGVAPPQGVIPDRKLRYFLNF